MKNCTICKSLKEEKEFYKDKSTKDLLTRACKECITAYRKENAERQRLYMRNKRLSEDINLYKRRLYLRMDPRKRMFNQAKNRAKRRNIPFSIELDDIIIPDKCPLLEISFIPGTFNNYEHTYSLDRIDSTKGYVKGNIKVISKLANSMKNSASKEELLIFAKNIVKYFDDDIVQTE